MGPTLLRRCPGGDQGAPDAVVFQLRRVRPWGVGQLLNPSKIAANQRHDKTRMNSALLGQVMPVDKAMLQQVDRRTLQQAGDTGQA